MSETRKIIVYFLSSIISTSIPYVFVFMNEYENGLINIKVALAFVDAL